MIEVSTADAAYIAGNGRTFKAKVTVAPEDDDLEEVVVSGTVRSVTINKGSCDSIALEPAAIFSNYATVTIDNCNTSFTDKLVRIYFGIGSNWYLVMTGFPQKPTRKGYTTTLEVQGGLSARCGRIIHFPDGWNFPKSVSSMLELIYRETGVDVYVESGLDDGIQIPVAPTGYTHMEVISMIAGLYFGYATEDATGIVHIKKYGSTSGSITANPARMASDPEFYDEETVAGVAVQVDSETEYSSGNTISTSVKNPLMTEAIFDAYNDNYTGFTYTPFNMELTLGDFRLEPWDTISITDKYTQETYTGLHCMAIQHTFDGGIKTTVSAPVLQESESYVRSSVGREAGIAYGGGLDIGGGTGGGGGSGGGYESDTGWRTYTCHHLTNWGKSSELTTKWRLIGKRLYIDLYGHSINYEDVVGIKPICAMPPEVFPAGTNWNTVDIMPVNSIFYVVAVCDGGNEPAIVGYSSLACVNLFTGDDGEQYPCLYMIMKLPFEENLTGIKYLYFHGTPGCAEFLIGKGYYPPVTPDDGGGDDPDPPIPSGCSVTVTTVTGKGGFTKGSDGFYVNGNAESSVAEVTVKCDEAHTAYIVVDCDCSPCDNGWLDADNDEWSMWADHIYSPRGTESETLELISGDDEKTFYVGMEKNCVYDDDDEVPDTMKWKILFL